MTDDAVLVAELEREETCRRAGLCGGPHQNQNMLGNSGWPCRQKSVPTAKMIQSAEKPAQPWTFHVRSSPERNCLRSGSARRRIGNISPRKVILPAADAGDVKLERHRKSAYRILRPATRTWPSVL